MNNRRQQGSSEEQNAHEHTHGTVDPVIVTTKRGVWAVKWSFVGLMLTAVVQVAIVYFSGSVALLADTIHNFGDASTAVPLWIAFYLARRKPTKRFTYGYGRMEDLAGAFIVLIILISAIVAGYESFERFLQPQPVRNLWAVAVASLVGFAGNELVALYRIRVGKEIHSAALVADGYHARVDGLTSLGVLASVVGIWLGYPIADPLVGVIITIVILRIVWESGKTVFMRLLDGVDPEVVDEIRHFVSHLEGIKEVTEVRVRWLGHRLYAELNLTVDAELSITMAHQMALEARHDIMHHLPYLSNVVVHVDPLNASGELYHQIKEHTHDDLDPHFHP